MIELKTNYANRIQRLVNTLTAADFVRLEVVCSMGWQLVTPPDAPRAWWGEILSRQATGQIDPAKLDRVVCKVINGEQTLVGLPDVLNQLLSKTLTLVLANGARDYALATVGHTDESKEEWERFQAALDSGAIVFVPADLSESAIQVEASDDYH
uniref:Uncharacterized protein n=1 Tax=viral metagenome TaxID=1070528 RepID=A0A6H1ZG28_9ZZZZ